LFVLKKNEIDKRKIFIISYLIKKQIYTHSTLDMDFHIDINNYKKTDFYNRILFTLFYIIFSSIVIYVILFLFPAALYLFYCIFFKIFINLIYA
jgi:hypothetical protein